MIVNAYATKVEKICNGIKISTSIGFKPFPEVGRDAPVVRKIDLKGSIVNVSTSKKAQPTSAYALAS